jgi:hypothetical protein
MAEVFDSVEGPLYFARLRPSRVKSDPGPLHAALADSIDAEPFKAGVLATTKHTFSTLVHDLMGAHGTHPELRAQCQRCGDDADVHVFDRYDLLARCEHPVDLRV